MPLKLLTRRRCFYLVLAAAGLAALAVLLALSFPQPILCIDSGEVRADCLVVLGGGSYERPLRAAELFRQNVAPRIIITGDGDFESNRRMLIREGVPAGCISIEPKARTTRENALFTIPILQELGARHVILVTSWYHSRRALRSFRHYAPDIQFFSRPAYFAFARADWGRQGMYRYIRAEYAKLAGYWIVYGISP